jgi:hypothetical protein
MGWRRMKTGQQIAYKSNSTITTQSLKTLTTMGYAHLIYIWPDALVAPHDEFNLRLFNQVKHKPSTFCILACPIFIELQNANIGLVEIRAKHYDILRQIDSAAKRRHESFFWGNTECSLVAISDLLSERDLAEAWERVMSLGVNDLEKAVYKNCEIGRTASVDLSLSKKAEFRHRGFKEVEEMIRLTMVHSIIAIDSLASILDPRLMCGNTHDTLLVQNSVYSQNLAFSEYARKYQINQCFVEASAMKLSTIKIYQSSILDQVNRRLLMAADVDHADPIEYYAFAREYLMRRITGNAPHAYSPVNGNYIDRSIEDEYPHSLGKMRYVYFTNSPDELSSGKANIRAMRAEGILPNNLAPFSSEYENIAHLAAYARVHPEVYIFVRMHPRLGADKRGLGPSYCRDEYIREISDLSPPSNFNLIYPEEIVPSYWLGCWCHGVLSYRGTMPLEMNLLGYNPLIGSAESGLINSTIDIHATESRRNPEEWEASLDNLYNNSSMYQLSRFCRDFYYSRMLGSIDLEVQSHGENLCLDLWKSLSCQTSLFNMPYRLPLRSNEKKALLIKYVLWLQEFAYKNIVAHSQAPVFAILGQLLRSAKGKPLETYADLLQSK